MQSFPGGEEWELPSQVYMGRATHREKMQLFKEYAQLGKVKFTRALTPPHYINKLLAVTSSEPSELMEQWCIYDGTQTKAQSSAKLTPLDHRGDAVFASCLKKHFKLHSWVQEEKRYHLVDSQTVIGAIQWESYSYQTLLCK